MAHNYIPAYKTKRYPLAFFSYIATDFGGNVTTRLKDISEQTGIPGSIIAAADIIKMVELHQKQPFTHAGIREIFAIGRDVRIKDIERINKEYAA